MTLHRRDRHSTRVLGVRDGPGAVRRVRRLGGRAVDAPVHLRLRSKAGSTTCSPRRARSVSPAHTCRATSSSSRSTRATRTTSCGTSRTTWPRASRPLRELPSWPASSASTGRRSTRSPRRRRRAAAPPGPGFTHGRARDAEAIHHHYDVSNRFYELLLGPSMAYTCAVYPTLDATLEEAQEEKFDLVCRKLELRPGMRLLDVGCGWGGMVRHAVLHYGVTAIGVTLSKEQAAGGRGGMAREGLGRPR